MRTFQWLYLVLFCAACGGPRFSSAEKADTQSTGGSSQTSFDAQSDAAPDVHPLHAPDGATGGTMNGSGGSEGFDAAPDALSAGGSTAPDAQTPDAAVIVSDGGAPDVQAPDAAVHGDAGGASCESRGVMVRAESSTPIMPFIGLDGFVGHGMLLQPVKTDANSDVDPNVQVYQACLLSPAPVTGSKVYFNPKYQNGTHLCLNDPNATQPCGRLELVSVWINGQSVSVSVGYLPGCSRADCDWMLIAQVP